MQLLIEAVWGGACDCISNKLPVMLTVLAHGPLRGWASSQRPC